MRSKLVNRECRAQGCEKLQKLVAKRSRRENERREAFCESTELLTLRLLVNIGNYIAVIQWLPKT